MYNKLMKDTNISQIFKKCNSFYSGIYSVLSELHKKESRKRKIERIFSDILKK
jgi:predicted transcriptional regulator